MDTFLIHILSILEYFNKMKIITMVVVILGSLSRISHSFAGVNVFSGAATRTSIASGAASAFGANVAATTTSRATPGAAYASATAVASGGKKHHPAPPIKKHYPVPPVKKHYPVPPPKKHYGVPTRYYYTTTGKKHG
eukprot:TRINITY_DN1875_c0_g1_i6.p4 TRINITY_DN1875_c0_g1~~TRINITY_DN1875_c0_g1_i6.p4  ORF type:complete len:137 (+),score=22.80 TRINITY_DN1875_c0_g1_i6:90-500(+)